MAILDDRASDQEMADTEYAIGEVRHKMAKAQKRTPRVPGYCDYCEGTTPSQAHLFCDLECSQADEREQRLRRQRA